MHVKIAGSAAKVWPHRFSSRNECQQRMGKSQHDQHAADDAKMECEISHDAVGFGFSKTNRPMKGVDSILMDQCKAGALGDVEPGVS